MKNDQIKVVEVFFKMLMQLFLAIVAVWIWAGVTFTLYLNPDWPMAAVETLLTITLGAVYKHFFPLGRRA